MLFTGLTIGAGKAVGRIASIDSGKKVVIVNVESGIDLKMGEMLEIDSGSGKIKLEVTYPMQTVAKCKIKGKGLISQLKKGMVVSRYSEDAETVSDKVDDASLKKTGFTEKFGDTQMVYIEGGIFTMGTPDMEPQRESDEVQHEVTLSPFWISKYEVTQKEYTDVTGVNPSNFKGDNLPVDSVNWYDAVEFCNNLSKKHNLKPYYKIDRNKRDINNSNNEDNLKYTVTILGGNGFRLSTEAEWEFACRAGTTTAYSYGNILDATMANFSGANRNTTTAVGSFQPNAYGLCDMHGNVWEWCWDWYGEYTGPVKDPAGAVTSTVRTMRGGSWNNLPVLLRSGRRTHLLPSSNGFYAGFRVARSAD